jgi:chromosome segregation protein
MYLRALTLKGFKSFASATTLRFEPGITCVVGPNGSGKSNIIDALTWVMGEQGVKSLRGGKMEDVIFAGTTGRAPLGRAEVSVTIDNTDGALPIEFSEVTISRILFRNGTSEYQINGETSRLLDIQELLSDSGLGREMHVVVGQGQVDSILSANPEERRAFIEEASGILKHRKRKEKALRRLEAMQANFARIQDLLTELRRQLKPLGKQAEVAKRAATIQADVRDAKLRLFADDLLQLQANLTIEVADENALRTRRSEVERELEVVRARENELEQLTLSQAPILTKAQDTFYQLNSLRERFRGSANLASERARYLSDSEDTLSLTVNPDALEREAVGIRAQEGILRQSLASHEEALRVASTTLATVESELKVRENELALALRAAADVREGNARREGEINSLKSRIQASESEIDRLARNREDALARANQAQQQFALKEAEIAGHGAGEERLDSDYQSQRQAMDSANTALENVRDRERSVERERSSTQARLEALKLSGASRDGSTLLLGAREVPVLGTLTSLMEVATAWEVAIGAALGSLGDAVVVGRLSDALDALTLLKREDAGRAEIVVVGNNEGEISVFNQSLPEGAHRAIDLITTTQLQRPLAHILGNTVVAESLNVAHSILQSYPGVRVVTKDGDILGRNLVSGGAKRDSSIIELNAAIESSERKLAELTHDGERLRFNISQALEKANSERVELDRVIAALNESDARMAALAEQIAVFSQTRTAAQGEADRLSTSINEANQLLAQHRTQLHNLESAPAPITPTVEVSSLDIEPIREKVSLARTVEMEARLTLRTGEERANAMADRAAQLERSAQNERDSRVRAIAKREARANAAIVAQKLVAVAYDALIQIELSINKAMAERSALEAARTEREGEILAIRGKNRELTAEMEQLTDSVHKDEIARAEQRMRIEQLEEKVVTDFGLDIQTLVSEYGPTNDVSTFILNDVGQVISAEVIPYRRDQQEKRLAAAERSLTLLGKINPLALEEFSALEERSKYLADQLEDLKKSRRDLLEIVREVNERVETIFKEAYRDTAKAFAEIFPRLFPGGDGRLSLTNPEDWLTSGVDVEARPPGKRIKRLSLLSGGERSLTAVALLIAIFKARPSPFYVLDEVEASLDDVNLGRLLEVLAELRADSQLIIVTHQKRTMEIADSLYGVTMRGDGVTEVISQRIGQVENA